MTVEERRAAPLETTQTARRGYLVTTTRAIFFVLGITQPAPEQERAISFVFWAGLLAVSLLCLGAVAAVIGSVSLLK